MSIFISWSGVRGKQVALGLREFLGGVFQGADVFMSEEDIARGEDWDRVLVEKLSKAEFGIICVTPESVNAPAILFEAGVMANTPGRAKVCPYLVDIHPSEIKWPLRRFHVVKAAKNTLQLVEAINEKRKRQLDARTLDKAFNKWWPDLKEIVNQLESPDVSVRWFRDATGIASTEGIAIILSAVGTHPDAKSSDGRPLKRHFYQSTGSGQVHSLAILLPLIDRAFGPEHQVCLAPVDQVVLERADLVLLGGKPTNNATKEVMDKLSEVYEVPFEYDDQTITFPEFGEIDPYPKDFEDLANVKEDHGLIVRCQNPFNLEKRVLCLLGTTTFGTEAAARLICTPREKEYPVNSATLIKTTVNLDGSRCANEEILDTIELKSIRRRKTPF